MNGFELAYESTAKHTEPQPFPNSILNCHGDGVVSLLLVIVLMSWVRFSLHFWY